MDLKLFTYELARRYTLDSEGTMELADGVTDKVLGWIRARDIDRLASPHDHIPDAYFCQDQTRFLRQIAAFFKKNEAFSSADGERNAELGFIQAEEWCSETNTRLDAFYGDHGETPVHLQRLIYRVQRKIAEVLGEFDDFIPVIPDEIKVTSGATATRPRRESEPYKKLRIRNLPCTDRATPYLSALYRYYGYENFTFRVVDENRVTTVLKNYKTMRTIACEPEGNLCLQLAFDGYVKRRLQKYGVDLSNQFKNQDLARVGSISDDLATIDLVSASNTLAYNAVAFSLPFDWFRFLDDIRSPKGRGFGKVFRYSMFSSMGNGATFTLETLIFACIVMACTNRSDWACYGDDLVVPKDALDDVLDLLQFFGFRINQEKSFVHGKFRESCGCDWFDGMDVTPFYVKFSNTMKIELCHLVNGLATISHPGGLVWEFLRDYVEKEDLLLVPFNESSISGVWVDPQTAYARKLIQFPKKQKDDQPYFMSQVYKAQVPGSKAKPVETIQTLSLWYFYSRAIRETEKLERGRDPSRFWREVRVSSMRTSSVSHHTHRYVRKWVSWRVPAQATPVHLYWWTDFLLRRETQ